MATYTQQAGGSKHVRLDVPIRAFWSKPRAWHGDDVVLHVETAYLPDDTPFEIAIFEAGAGDGDEPIDVLDKGLKLTKNRAAVPYTIKWDTASRGKPLVLQRDDCTFVFVVKIDAPKVSGRSNELYVHLHRYVVSG
jgi:hypothetical protein